MRPRDSIAFRFLHFSRTSKKRSQQEHLDRQSSQRETDFLTSQLSAANKENSALRKEIVDQRDINTQQIHSLRQQKLSLDARITALTEENEALKAEMQSSVKQKQIEGAALRTETESLKRQLADAQRKKTIIKSAVKELTQELSSVNILHAATKQELRIVKRERETALDDACNIHIILEREREEHEFKEFSLQKEIMELRKVHSQIPKNNSRTRDLSPLRRKKPDDDTNENGRGKSDLHNPLVTDSISTEILTPRPGSDKYHVLFNPQIPMTPIRALDNSPYVVRGHGFDSIREPAFATIEFGKPRTDFTMLLNEPFSAWGSAERPIMMYIGLEYPDGTSLCYVPIKEVTVKRFSPRDPSDGTTKQHGLTADYGRDYVQLSVREEVYSTLVEQAKDVFATRYSTETIELPRVSYGQWARNSPKTVSLTVSMKPDARVERKIDSRKHKTLISKELHDNKEDMVGDALLAMRFSKAYPSEARYTLGFKLHGMFTGTR